VVAAPDVQAERHAWIAAMIAYQLDEEGEHPWMHCALA